MEWAMPQKQPRSTTRCSSVARWSGRKVTDGWGDIPLLPISDHNLPGRCVSTPPADSRRPEISGLGTRLRSEELQHDDHRGDAGNEEHTVLLAGFVRVNRLVREADLGEKVPGMLRRPGACRPPR